MNGILRFVTTLFGRDGQAGEEHRLALRVESLARSLNGDPTARPPESGSDLRAILRTAAVLLERAEQKLGAAPGAAATAAGPPPQPPPPELVESARSPAPGGGPTATVEELIRLRDWVLVASGQEQPSPQVLSAVYRRLGQALEREGVTPVEKAGPYDESCQEVVATQPTSDARQHHQVAESVRPGYLVSGAVLRPEQVVVYVFEVMTAPA